MAVAPKRPKGPPLNAMRAFEAAARHVSFVAAAEELNVTPGAISQHVKTLEGWAGTTLFQRQAQGVVLTSAGQSLVADFAQAFDALAQATHALRNLNTQPEFHIAALPAIAQLWLPKRLSRVRNRFPDISFSVTALETPPCLSRELFDMAIFFGIPEASPDQVVLCEDQITPVCAPSVKKLYGLAEGDRHPPLLQDQSWSEDWQVWCDATGVRLSAVQRGPQFSLYSLAVEEAKSGAGALMGHLCLLQDALRAGTLVRMHQATCVTGRSLMIDMPRASHRRAETEHVAALLGQP